MTDSQFPLEHAPTCSCLLTSADTVMLLSGKIHIIAIVGFFFSVDICVTVRQDLVHVTSSISISYLDFHCKYIYIDIY